MLNFHKQCFPEMKIVSLRFGIQKQHFFHYPTKMPHTSKVAPLYGKLVDLPYILVVLISQISRMIEFGHGICTFVVDSTFEVNESQSNLKLSTWVKSLEKA